MRSGAVFFNVKNFLIEDNIFTWTGYHDSLVEPRQHGTEVVGGESV